MGLYPSLPESPILKNHQPGEEEADSLLESPILKHIETDPDSPLPESPIEDQEPDSPRLISAVKNKIAFVKFDPISLKKYSIMVHIRNSNIREPRSGEPNQVVVANGPIKMTQDVRFFSNYSP